MTQSTLLRVSDFCASAAAIQSTSSSTTTATTTTASSSTCITLPVRIRTFLFYQQQQIVKEQNSCNVENTNSIYSLYIPIIHNNCHNMYHHENNSIDTTKTPPSSILHRLFYQIQARMYDYVHVQLIDPQQDIENYSSSPTTTSSNTTTRRLIVQLIPYVRDSRDNIQYDGEHQDINDDNVFIDTILAMNLGYCPYYCNYRNNNTKLYMNDNSTSHNPQQQPVLYLQIQKVDAALPSLVTNTPITVQPQGNDDEEDEEDDIVVTLYYVTKRSVSLWDQQHHSNNWNEVLQQKQIVSSVEGSKEQTNMPLPPIGSMIQSNTITTVLVTKEESNCKNNHTITTCKRLWEYVFVVGTIQSNRNIEHCKNVKVVTRTTAQTQYCIYTIPKTNTSFMVPLVVPPVVQYSDTDEIQQQLLHNHPIISTTLRQWNALYYPPKQHQRYDQRIVEQYIYHIIGTNEEHDLGHIIESIIAPKLGRNCFTINGLAAYAALYNMNESKSDTAITTTIDVSTGGWIDKLYGLQLALHHAIQQSPSILLLSDFDLELLSSTINSDNGQRTLDEGRIWTLITNTLSSLLHTSYHNTTTTVSSGGSTPITSPTNEDDNDDYIHTTLPSLLRDFYSAPAVIVVIVTSTALPPTSYMKQQFFHPSMDCSTLLLSTSNSDTTYIEYIWTSSSNRCRISPSVLSSIDKIKSFDYVVNKTVPMSKVIQLMEGRRIYDILDIRDSYIIAVIDMMLTPTTACSNTTRIDVDGYDSTTYVKVLEALCTERDTDRQNKSGVSGRIEPVHWADIGGLDHVKNEIRNTIELPLKYPHLFSTTSLRQPSGILLYGPPGTGKTFVAKAVATEYGLPFLSVKGPELLGSYVGESEAQVRAIFQQARRLAQQNQPKACILFFDELDSLAPRRGDHSNSGGGVMDRVVASLFIELDRDPTIDDNNSVLVFCIGATNRPDMLDPALLRPGRFDRLVYLGVSPSDHIHILLTHLRKLRLDGDVEQISRDLVEHLPSNLTAADLSTIASGALMRATERLCDEADRQLTTRKERQQQSLSTDGKYDDSNIMGEEITIDDILASWSEIELEPLVTFNDLLEVAKATVPSVSKNELDKYEQLHKKYQFDARKQAF